MLKTQKIHWISGYKKVFKYSKLYDIMSEENHPNIHAVGFTVDLLNSIKKRLRNKGETYKKDIMSDEDIKEKIIDFIADISSTIDEIVEVKEKNI